MVSSRFRPAPPLRRRAGRTVFQIVLILAACALAALAAVQLTRWLDDVGEKAASGEDRSTPSIEIVNAQSIVLREDGRKVLEVSARRITVSPDHRFADAWQVSKGVLFRDGQPFLQLQAEKVRINQLTRDLMATGLVKAHGPDGFSLRTQRADWTHEKKLLDCPQPVQATLRGVRVATSRAAYDATRRRLNCPQPVRAVWHGTTFTARNATYDAPTNELHCSGAVRLLSKGASLRGGDVRVNTKRQTVQMAGPVEITAQPGTAPALSELLPLPWPTPSAAPTAAQP
jgi:hypothetical protein